MKLKGSKKAPRSEGKMLSVAAVSFAVIAVLLTVVLLDQCFVPSGDTWNELKQYYMERQGMAAAADDKEVWQEIRQEMLDLEFIHFPSSVWLWMKMEWYHNEEKREEARRQEKVDEAAECAQAAVDVLNSFLSELSSAEDSQECFVLDIIFYHGEAQFSNFDDNDFSADDKPFGEKTEDLLQQLNEAFSDTRNASIKAVVQNGKCTSAAFASGFAVILSADELPYFDENGRLFEGALYNAACVNMFEADDTIIGYANPAVRSKEDQLEA